MTNKDFYRIGRVRISVTTEDHAINMIKEAIHARQKDMYVFQLYVRFPLPIEMIVIRR